MVRIAQPATRADRREPRIARPRAKQAGTPKCIYKQTASLAGLACSFVDFGGEVPMLILFANKALMLETRLYSVMVTHANQAINRFVPSNWKQNAVFLQGLLRCVQGYLHKFGRKQP